ncbi:Amylo-alpha-1,6-glucosidase family protein [Trichomonas vaginalis G3]|uniref:Glycogen debranching enzyme n=1 Tax=Trichomonas vaginalis (strain ATCC PRA-98 / G3) TaxID=412133 RepID=GDE_TRIV3|nr:glycogen debranching enzyme family [Trichomonas vaginalis G3]EAY00134.1 Amylo-alpha-1,6-glucosidase family protein [Trichomonas vaginalis G3]KAI5522736.1 glycogen debranching enzyme family [Trichomonas vaginalis G3]|eukprot:XP_001313063.1 Amylo-alpha-1,6-glucosidase family protein [Trichomonas vaginalis G3]
MKPLTLRLNNDGGVEIGIIRISAPDHTLNVVVPIGTDFHSPTTILETNHPSKTAKTQTISQSKDYSCMEDIVFSIPLTIPGAFVLKLKNATNVGPAVHFIVDPVITINNKKVPASGLNIQTNYGRCIGTLDKWLENLTPISKIGYNMIHLPPFQELGHHSHYSIKDQLQISKYLLPKGFDKSKAWNLFTKTVKEIESKLNIVFMVDIVLNHTNQDSPRLSDHPEAGYNEENSPHLIPAIYLDNLLNELSNEIAAGKVENLPPDLPASKRDELYNFLRKRILESDFARFFTIDEKKAIETLANSDDSNLTKSMEMLRMRSLNYGSPQRLNILRTRGVINEGTYKMDSIHIDNSYAMALFKFPGRTDESRLHEFELAIKTINAPFVQHFENLVNDVVTAIVNGFCYNRYDPNGPKLGPITVKTPISWRYFTPITAFKGTKQEKLLHLANNGWLFGAKPTEDFISKNSEAYLRRQVVIWGDCVKLRYGDKPEDNPWLWSYMQKYVESVARVTHGIRLDNAHSTPLNVAEYFIQKARDVNPSLYIMAELFTGGEDEDIKYINHIGINSILREAFHNLAPDKLSHMLWLSGGRPVAAIDPLDTESILRPLRQIPGVIFDLTHDNPTPYFDRLSAAAAITMASSPIATTRGFDEYLNFNPSVVEEFRIYPHTDKPVGIQAARLFFNELHTKMAVNGLDELMAHYHGNLLSLFRYNSHTGVGVWMVTRTSNDNWVNELECLAPIKNLIFEARTASVKYNDSTEEEIIPGDVDVEINTNFKKMKFCEIRNNSHLVLNDFPVGAVVAFSTQLPQPQLQLLKDLEVRKLADDLVKWTSQLSFADLSILMFRCGAEEGAQIGTGSYSFPQYGPCFYAGTQGILTAFDSSKDMGSPIFQNMRDGNWLCDFMIKRLYQAPHLIPILNFMRGKLDKIITLPRFTIPKYIDRLIRALDIFGREQLVRNMSNFVKNGDDFVQSLAFSSVALYGPVRDAPLINSTLSKIFDDTLVERQDCCLAAGLPHFSSGYMRSWGRDTFISLRGIFMTTGRFTEARDHLIAFGACLRHGLIPNLHDSCLNPRYNARDATWWFLQALQDYALMAPDGKEVFTWKVPQLFPTDDQQQFERRWAGKQTRPIRTMADVVMDIMTRHANGIHFVEWNAGTKIDSVMVEHGFHINIVTDWSNGFILGGNCDNCGTWMDKMGSSTWAKNSGVPSTPRDGAAIEIIGLLASTLRWLSEENKAGRFPYDGVNVEESGKKITFNEWHSILAANFESWFYIPADASEDDKYFIEHSFVSVRGIYKDTVGASNEFGDYQFRPNVPIAMTVAPELFDPRHAIHCLNLVEERLMGKIAMKTLDSADWRYNPYYENSVDNDNFYSAKGANYHNGPEWVWPTGYFFRASMKMSRGVTPGMTKMLANIKSYLLNSWAKGLPELTNLNGAVCNDSCVTQAWSIAAILDILYDHNGYSKEDVTKWSAAERLD